MSDRRAFSFPVLTICREVFVGVLRGILDSWKVWTSNHPAESIFAFSDLTNKNRKWLTYNKESQNYRGRVNDAQELL